MKKLQALTDTLIKKINIQPEQVYASAESCRLNLTGSDFGQGLEICLLTYDAVIDIENYSDDAIVIIAMMSAWILEQDENRHQFNLPEPVIDVTVNDTRTADIEIKLSFVESIQLVPDELGKITLDGQNYKIDYVPINFAQKLDEVAHV